MQPFTRAPSPTNSNIDGFDLQTPKYEEMIEPKGTADDSFQSPVSDNEMSSLPPPKKRSRLALILFVAGFLFVIVAIGVITMVVMNSGNNGGPSNNEGGFDFEAVIDTPTPTTMPTIAPSLRPSVSPTSTPSGNPSTIPSTSPSSEPSTSSPSSIPSTTPTAIPSFQPSANPSGGPTLTPSTLPSSIPSSSPSTTSPTNIHSSSPTAATAMPTTTPTLKPSQTPSQMPIPLPPIANINYNSDTLTTFCVIADVPYKYSEEVQLPIQIETQTSGCEFLIHLGDIMKGDVPCNDVRYEKVRNMLLEAQMPTFIVPGDNEWNDCGNNNQIDRAWERWSNNFMQLENNWNHTFDIIRQDGHPENFYFLHKKTLFFGLNIVGGRVHSRSEWLTRLQDEINWVTEITGLLVPKHASGIIIMAHAAPKNEHRHFFDPLSTFIEQELENNIPVLYLHGDGHDFIYTPYYYDQPNYLRMQHEGGTRDPVLKIFSDPKRLGPNVWDSFQYDQQLHLERL